MQTSHESNATRGVHSHVLQNHKPPKKKNEKRTKSNGKSSTVFGAHSFQTNTKLKKKKKNLTIITANLTIGRGPIGL